MKLSKPLGTMLLTASLATGCGQPDPAPPAAEPDAEAPATALAPAGFIEIDGKKWTVVADVRCSVKPGPVVSIVGHAAEDEGTRIVVEFDAGGGPTGVSVVPSNGTTEWHAEHAMNLEIVRKQVKGAGYFAGTLRGGTRQAEGRFDINCR